MGELDKAAGLDHVFAVGHGVLSVDGCAFVHELMSGGSLGEVGGEGGVRRD